MWFEIDEKLVSSAIEDLERKKRSEDFFEPRLRFLPQEFIDVIEDIGGYDVEFVMEKPLSKTDTKPAPYSHLTMPFSAKARRKFLTDIEEMILFNGVPVLLIEPSLEVREMSLFSNSVCTTRNSDPSCMLVDNWDIVQKKNGLKTGDLVQLWMFKLIDFGYIKEPKIGFALVRVSEEGQEL